MKTNSTRTAPFTRTLSFDHNDCVLFSRRVFLAVWLTIGLMFPAIAKRSGPLEVKEITIGAVVYSAPHDAMGFVVATNGETKMELWRVRIYEVKKDPKLEGDVQDVFITSLVKDGESLIVTNEQGKKFRLNLATQKVTAAEK